MTRDLWVTGERYSEVDEGFVPWQPNASNNGRLLDLLADRFLLEGESRLVLMGGFAPFEKANVSIDGLRTKCGGRFSLKRADGMLVVEWERAIPNGTVIVIPDHLAFCPQGTPIRRVSGEMWETTAPTKTLRGEVSVP